MPFSYTPSEFAASFSDAARRTERLVREFGEGDLAIRPGEGSMSAAEQIAHLCASRNFIRGLLEDEVVEIGLFHRAFDVGTPAAAVRSLEESRAEVVKAAAGAATERWGEVIEPFGPDWRMSRGELAYVMMEHEIHHRGALHVYARLAGKVPPVLYAPVEKS